MFIIIILFSGRGCFIVISFVLPAGLSQVESRIQNERPFLCPFFNFFNLFFVVVAQEKEMELETLREKNRRDTEGLNKKLQV